MSRSDEESYAQNRWRTSDLERRKQRIRQLNDDLRRLRAGGRIMITPGVNGLGSLGVMRVLETVAAFNSFSPDNDPKEEHDFGAFDYGGTKLFWKIDYYDKALEFGSPDPADPEVTARVLTIMLASEY